MQIDLLWDIYNAANILTRDELPGWGRQQGNRPVYLYLMAISKVSVWLGATG